MPVFLKALKTSTTSTKKKKNCRPLKKYPKNRFREHLWIIATDFDCKVDPDSECGLKLSKMSVSHFFVSGVTRTVKQT